jgi:hypothetical protein
LKTSKKTKTEKELLPAPPVGPGMVSLAITETDLATFVNLMTICAKTFDQLALKSAEDNDAISYKILLARAQLSAVFANKLSECVKMPEPVSRDMH